MSHPEDERPWSWDQPLPNAFIQWKGTNVCTDLYCVCGEQWHLDQDFTYSVRCPHCQRTFYMEPFVKLWETTDAHAVEYAKTDPEHEVPSLRDAYQNPSFSQSEEKP